MANYKKKHSKNFDKKKITIKAHFAPLNKKKCAETLDMLASMIYDYFNEDECNE